MSTPAKTRFLTAIALAVVLIASNLYAVDTRPFAPVQDGFTTEAPQVELYAPDRVLVKFTADAAGRMELQLGPEKGASTDVARTGLAAVDAILAEAGARSIERPYPQPARADKAAAVGVDRWYMVHVAPGDMVKLAGRLSAVADVESASPDWRAFPMTVPDDTYYPDHWGHNNTAQLPAYDWGGTWDHTGPGVGTVGFDANAEAAWDAAQGFGSSSVVIAIIDSGVDIYHPDLNCTTGYDFGDNDTNPMDDSRSAGHGTCCAGVAAAVAGNGLGVAGIAGNCTIMPLKAADWRGNMYFSYIQAALYYAADHGADVISMSLGAALDSDAATDDALQYAYAAGCVILAATGNENNSVISYPAINQYVIGVGAASPCGDRKRSSSDDTELNPGVYPDPNGYTCDGERWWGSNYGSTTPDDRGAVDVIAPTILPTTDISGSAGYDAGDYDMFFNGTSCATPYAAGVCALIKSAFPDYGPAEIRQQLVSTAIDIVNVESGSGWDRYTGYGMVDAAAAVAGGGGTTPTLPVAAFTASPTSGTAPLTVSFTDQSTGSPTGWSWDFGDGATSTLQNPGHTYDAAGSYTVSLTVTNADGSDTETKVDYIVVSDPSSGGGTMHVDDIDVYSYQQGRWVYGKGIVTIVDDSGAPVSGATVSVTYTGPTSGTLSGLTGTDGTVTFGTARSSSSGWCFEVTDVTHAALTYDPSANEVTKSCESGDVYGADAGLAIARLSASPNPFNPLTEVKFGLARTAPVKLTVYDVRGRVADVLVDGILGAGEHVVRWNAVDRPSGVYFARLETGGTARTVKLILLK